MKNYKEIISESIYDKNKMFAKEYDKFHDAMSAMSKIIKKEGNPKATKKFNTAWEDIEQAIDDMS